MTPSVGLVFSTHMTEEHMIMQWCCC